MARYCDPDANVQSGERFAEQSILNTPLPRLSTDSIGGLSSPTVNWNHTRLRLQNLVFCRANACSDRKVMQLAGLLNPYRGILSNVDIGTVAFPEQFREATIYRCLDGVGDLETLLRGIGPEPTPLSAEYPDLASLVNSSRMTNEAWKCVKATALFSPVHLMNVVTKARQTALTLCLECESKGIELRWLGNEDDESGSYRQWLRTLRDENAKEAIRTVWTGLRKALFAAVEHYGS